MMQVDMNAIKDKAEIKNYFIGSMLSGGSSDPADISPEGWSKAVRMPCCSVPHGVSASGALR